MNTVNTKLQEAKAQLYAWLSVVFYAPEGPMVSSEFASEGQKLAEALGCYAGTELFVKLISENRTSSTEVRLLAVQREYARLFLGPPKALIQPYECCYFGEHQLMGARSMQVAQFYQQHLVSFHKTETSIPPDHIAVELEFLSMLCNGEIPVSDTAAIATIEQDFMSQHLSQWGFLFAHDVKEQTTELLYHTAAVVLDDVLKQISKE